MNDFGNVGSGDVLPRAYGPEQDSSAASTSGTTGLVSKPFTVGGTQSIIATVTADLNPDCLPQVGCPYVEIRTAGGQGVYAPTASGTYYVTLAPGNYVAKASNEYSGGWAVIHVIWRDLTAVKKKLGGGLRIAQLTTADATGNVTARKYLYTRQSDTTRSSGVVNREPAYGFQYNSSTCQYFSRSSTSQLPLGSGPPIGYSEVTVWLGAGGGHGKTRHAFRSVLDAADISPLPGWPQYTVTSQEWLRGQETGATEYNGSGQIQQRHAAAYTFNDGQGMANYTRFRGLSINQWSAGAAGSNYYYNRFEVRSGWSYQHADTMVAYDEGGTNGFTTTRTYAYGNPAHIQPTQITESNSDGTQRITRLKYPGDYATGSGNPEAAALTAMQGATHIHNPVIERWVVQKEGSGETVVQAEITSWRQFLTGQYLPYQRFVLNTTGVIP